MVQQNIKFIYTNQYEKKCVLEEDIIAFSKNGKDVEIYLNNHQNDWFIGTIKEIEGKLKSDCFIKISQSAIININYIKALSKGVVVMTDGREYKVSRDYQKKIWKKIK